MVNLVGKLGPLRITRHHLMDLAKQLDEKLPPMDTSDPTDWRFNITLGNFSEQCPDIGWLDNFLRNMNLPSVVHEFEFTVSSSHPYLNYPSVTLRCDSNEAKYSIRQAPRVDEATALQALIKGFRDKHGASRLFTPPGGYAIGLLLFIALLDLPSRFQTWTGYERMNILTAIPIILIIVYMIWSYYTKNTPATSFRHSVLYMEKEPKNSVLWVLLFGIIADIVVTVVLKLLVS